MELPEKRLAVVVLSSSGQVLAMVLPVLVNTMDLKARDYKEAADAKSAPGSRIAPNGFDATWKITR